MGADRYAITAAPLQNRNGAVDVSSTNALRDFIFDRGKPNAALLQNAEGLTVLFDDGSWVNATGGLNTAPALLRRLPEPIASAGSNPFIQVDVNCSGAISMLTNSSSRPAAVACGLVVMDGATRMPLLFWGLKRTNA